MRRLRPRVAGVVLVGLGLLIAGVPGVAAPAAAQDVEVADVEVVDAGTAALIEQATADAAGGVLVRWVDDVDPDRRAAVLDAAGPVRSGAVTPLGPRVDHVRVPTAGVAGTAARLSAAAEVAAAEADHIIVLLPGAGPTVGPSAETVLSADTVVSPAEVDLPDTDPRATLTLPNDPLFGLQWGMYNTGQAVGPDGSTTVGIPGIDINLLPAWQTTRGERDVVVAVIDTAVDTTHPDLRDVVVGQFATTSGASGSRDHGTQVASLIAARADDAVGIVGVAPGVSLVSITAFAAVADGSPVVSTLQSVVAAFEVAVDVDADVINASWVTSTDSDLLRVAIADAGVPVVAASGNDFRTLTATDAMYPAGYNLPNLLTVTAIDPQGSVPGFANIGPDVVDLGAPGATMAVAAEFGGHQWADGTSYATPLVAGGLALARSAAPYASTTDLIDAVERTTRVLPSLVSATRTGGMLDVDALVRGVQRPVCPPGRMPPPTFSDVSPGSVHAMGIGCVQYLELVNGQVDGTFQPAAVVTREQLASVLANLLDRVEVADDPVADDPVADDPVADDTDPQPDDGTDDPATEDPATDDPATDDPVTDDPVTDDPVTDDPAGFSDVSPDSPHAASIERLARLGIIQGDDGRFRPRDPVTRGQLATFLVGTYEQLIGDTGPPSRRWFPDTATSAHVTTIDRGRDLGVLRGVTRETFGPGQGTRRDQLATQVAQLVDALSRAGATVGPGA